MTRIPGRIIPLQLAQRDLSAQFLRPSTTRVGEQMILPSPHRGGPTKSPHQVLEARIFDAYQHVKRARRDGDFATICGWISEVDKLLERYAELNAKARASTPA
jgi:hypothetical protein